MIFVCGLLVAALFWLGYSDGDEKKTDPIVAVLTGLVIAGIPLLLGLAIIGIWSLV